MSWDYQASLGCIHVLTNLYMYCKSYISLDTKMKENSEVSSVLLISVGIDQFLSQRLAEACSETY
jgi:hypothetical protein